MRTIIAGSREGPTAVHLGDALAKCGWVPSVVLSGTARGADRVGEQWALLTHTPIEKYPANWDEYGKRAGYVRNQQMAERAEALIALWDGASKGTHHMIVEAKRRGLRVHVERIA